MTDEKTPPDETVARPSVPPVPRSEPTAFREEKPLETGTVIHDRFVLAERLGAGGMGVVFKARDLRREEAQDRDPYVALKFLNAEFRRHPDSLMALEREARRAMQLAHPNIVTVHDFNRDSSHIFLHMEFLKGEPLDQLIARNPQGMTFKEAWPLVECMGSALKYAHEQGVIHSDFKPGNVFVVGPRRAKVLDFGISRVMKNQGEGSAEGTRFDAGTLGAMTPAYASPEILLGDDPDPRDDVYALACVTYELLSGRHPFNGMTAVKAAHEGLKIKRTRRMGRYQYKALVHALAFRQAMRTPTIEQFLDEFDGPFDVRARTLKRVLAYGAGLTVLVGAIGVAAWWRAMPDPDGDLQARLSENAAAAIEQRRRAGGEVEEVDPELVKMQLEQASDYITLAQQEFNAGWLSEGVSSAYGAFLTVLKADPTNRAALDGVVEIVRLYEAEIERRMAAGDFAAAAELARYARRIDPDRPTLVEFQRSAEAALATSRQ